MATINYNFSTTTSACTATSPLTIVFDPSSLGFISKLIYSFPNKTITRTRTFVTDPQAQLEPYNQIDVRAPLTFTLDGTEVTEDGTTYVVTVTAVSGFSQTNVVYTLSATLLQQYVTKNPTGASQPYTFENIHLLKTRVWGPGNSQLFILETKSPNYLLLNFNGGNEIPTVIPVNE